MLLLFLLIGLNLLFAIYFPKDHALDLKFAYSPEEAYLALSQLDSGKREAYFYSIWLLDMPYPVIYSAFFWGISYWLWNKKWVLVPAIMAFFADFLENLFIIQLLSHFPEQRTDLVIFASLCTSMKWIFVAAIFLVIATGLFRRYVWVGSLQEKKK